MEAAGEGGFAEGGRSGERRTGERRWGERRSGGRRAEDRRERRLRTAYAAAWAIVGAIVVLYLFFSMVGTVDPSDAVAASIVILVLAIAWIAHAWWRLFHLPHGYVSRPDRERRGF
jgi:protein-S-isoprenylcysteine O-methyltransferase Ste14